MRMLFTLPLLIALTLPTSVAAQGRLGGGRLGGGKTLGKVDAKALRFELDMLMLVNGLRKKKGLAPLTFNEQLRTMARQQSEWGATGSPLANGLDARVKKAKLAPLGYRMQYAAGTKAMTIMKELRKDEAAVEMLSWEFARIGIGAFWVPDAKPYFQVSILMARDPDPMAGKPGLTKRDTDPVMKHAADAIKRQCYDFALRRDPNLVASLVFQIVIGAGGNVDTAKLLSKSSDIRFNDCALQQVRVARFPAPYKDKPVTLNHPMRFAPEHGTEKKIGELSSTQIQRAFSAARADFKKCYDTAIETKPKLSGTITLAISVSKDGGILTLEVQKDSLGDGKLQRCIVTRARRVRFPAPKFGGTARVIFPLSFSPPK